LDFAIFANRAPPQYTADVTVSYPALPISLYVTNRDVVLVGDGPSADRRAARLAATGARVIRVDAGAFDANACRGARAVIVQIEPAPPNVEAIRDAARDAGALCYVADRPDLSDFAMPGIAERGPIKLAISSDAIAPALTRRLREQLERLLDDAGDRLDALVTTLASARASLPREGRAAALYAIASRLRIGGAIEIDDD
jgi:siroheme synthase (precorrin-2 oxidase/ferrochelatase)